ncbi:MAG: formylglycine-generating enzyme family protein, partial [Planctomycetota bacterium]
LDAVEAVPDAEERTLDFAAGDGDAEVKLIRGDGLTVTLTTPVADTAGVRIRAVADERRIEITFPGRPVAIPSGRGKEPFRAALPPVTLRVEAAEPDAAPRTRVNPVDGAELVWIPAGSFLRGSNAPDSQRGERPERRIHLDGYWIYRTPVTAAMYRTFCEATGRKMPAEFWGKALEGETPMLGLNWRQAAAYAEWAGVRLPTEAQWERAARGDDGRVYPWGNAWDPDRCWCQANTLHADEPWPHPVRTRPAGTSPFGVEDMAGNCWEYVRDWHAPDAHRRSPAINPAGPGSGTHKVLKGGSWQWDRTYLRSAYREANPPHIDNWLWVGFRCVLDQAAPTRDQETNTEAD